MVKNYQYTSIKELIASLKGHPLLEDISFEKVIRYTLQFIGRMGMPKLYQDRQETIPIEEYRGVLPCDLISIIQVKDVKSGICLKSMTDNFYLNSNYDSSKFPTFKTQGSIIYTSFKTGEVEIAYKAIPTDDDGFPSLIDNEVFKMALEAYIKKCEFTILFDMGKINQNVLQNAQQEYAWAAGQCQSEFTIPSISEMESIKSMWTSMIQRNDKFYNGFKDLNVNHGLKIK